MGAETERKKEKKGCWEMKREGWGCTAVNLGRENGWVREIKGKEMHGFLFCISHSVIWTTESSLHKTDGRRLEKSSCSRIKKCINMWGHFIVLATKDDCFSCWHFLWARADDINRGLHRWKEKVRQTWRRSLRQTNKDRHKERKWLTCQRSKWPTKKEPMSPYLLNNKQ